MKPKLIKTEYLVDCQCVDCKKVSDWTSKFLFYHQAMQFIDLNRKHGLVDATILKRTVHLVYRDSTSKDKKKKKGKK